MNDEEPYVLAVDDDPINLEILATNLEDYGYRCLCAESGEEALDQLRNYTGSIQVVLLDRMMPKMDGIQVLKEIKRNPAFNLLPVIMQTAAASSQEIKEGIEAGSFYYLTKPYKGDVLRAIVRSAIEDFQKHSQLEAEIAETANVFSCLNSAEFHFHTFEQAAFLAKHLSKIFPTPQKVAIGLAEILTNAIEHGNLGITFHEKTCLIDAGELEAECNRRLANPDISKKYALLYLEQTTERITITVSDQGQGFDWQRYIEMGMDLSCTSHGRGIALAKTLSFDTLEYSGVGNVVSCSVYLTPSAV